MKRCMFSNDSGLGSESMIAVRPRTWRIPEAAHGMSPVTDVCSRNLRAMLARHDGVSKEHVIVRLIPLSTITYASL
jgi:hypothetical protein